MKNQRRRIWIDRFQTYLFLRIAAYCVLYQVAVWFLVVIERSIFAGVQEILGPGVARGCFLFLSATVVLLGFLFVYDAVRFAHRIVGPLYRFRKTLQAIAAADDVDLVKLRKGDFLQEMRDDFNTMIRALEQRGAVTVKSAEAGHEAKQPVSV